MAQPAQGGVKDWGQTKKTVTFTCHVGHTSLKKIDLAVFDLCVKINLLEKKEVLLIDLHDKVDIGKLSHSFRLQRKTLKITLKKLVHAEWPHLHPRGLKKEDMQRRRYEAFRRKEEHER